MWTNQSVFSTPLFAPAGQVCRPVLPWLRSCPPLAVVPSKCQTAIIAPAPQTGRRMWQAVKHIHTISRVISCSILDWSLWKHYFAYACINLRSLNMLVRFLRTADDLTCDSERLPLAGPTGAAAPYWLQAPPQEMISGYFWHWYQVFCYMMPVRFETK